MTQGNFVTTTMIKDVRDSATIQDYLDGQHGQLSTAARRLLEVRQRQSEAQTAWPPSTPILNTWLNADERLLEVLRDTPGIAPGLPRKSKKGPTLGVFLIVQNIL
jgi:hypothetical protein